MPTGPSFNLTDEKVSQTFSRLIQTDGEGNFYDGFVENYSYSFMDYISNKSD